MLKKTVTYTDYNGVERTEDFYFHVNKAEMIDMELGQDGGYTTIITNMVRAKDRAQMIKLIKEFVLKAYGEKSADGKRFVKSKEISEAFSQTEAFVQIYMELVTDEKAASEFVTGVFPADVMEKAKSLEAIDALPDDVKDLVKEKMSN